MIRCSVVVPAYNPSQPLSRTLEALTSQSIAPDEYEIIVCDDGQSAETRRVVERWQETGPVSMTYLGVPAPRNGPAAVRNAGWRAGRGEVIAFTDAEALPDRDWLRQGLLALADDIADAAAGRIMVEPGDNSSGHRRRTRLETERFSSVNCFCRRDVLRCVGGFDAHARASRREDNGLFGRLIEKGFDVVHAIDAVVVLPRRRAERTALPHALEVIVASAVMPMLSLYDRLRTAPIRDALR